MKYVAQFIGYLVGVTVVFLAVNFLRGGSLGLMLEHGYGIVLAALILTGLNVLKDGYDRLMGR